MCDMLDSHKHTHWMLDKITAAVITLMQLILPVYISLYIFILFITLSECVPQHVVISHTHFFKSEFLILRHMCLSEPLLDSVCWGHKYEEAEVTFITGMHGIGFFADFLPIFYNSFGQ